jgi:hypothetical protein
VRADRGQASIEWLALVALITLLLGFGFALTHATFLGHRVTREMARALCLVRQGDCRRDQEPCPIATDERRRGFSVDVVFVRLGGGQMALVERLSDGTVRVTRAPDTDGGLEAALGVGVKVKAGGIDLAVSAEVQASILARLHRGETWVVRDEAAADDLLDKLKARGGGLFLPVPEPDLSYGDVDLRSSLGGTAGVGGLVRLGSVEGGLTFDKHAGSRVDHRTGRRTVYTRAADTHEVRAAFGRGILDVGWSSAGPTETYAVEFDAAGRPLDLQILAVGAYDGSSDLPAAVAPVASLLRARAADGRARIYEITGHLDLTVPANLAAARDVLAELARTKPHVGRAAAASDALRRRFDEEGTIEARVLERKTDGTEVGAHGALGAKVGGQYSNEHTVTRLIGATSRGLDGNWLPRLDCVAEI